MDTSCHLVNNPFDNTCIRTRFFYFLFSLVRVNTVKVSETQLTEILEKLQWSVLRKVGVPPKRKREGRSPSEKPQKRPKLESS